MGKVHEMAAAMAQCVKLPSAWPRARTRFGKISLMKTQITAPWPNACDAMKTSRLDQHHHAPGRGEVGPVSVKGPGRGTQADDVADRADEHQSAAAEVVDHGHRQHGEDQVRPAHGHRLQERGSAAGAGHREDGGGVVHERVDARELVEHGDRHGQQDRPPVLPLEERLFLLRGARGPANPGSRRISWSTLPASVPSFPRTVRASSTRPWATSQRGVSGVRNRRKKNAAEGTA